MVVHMHDKIVFNFKLLMMNEIEIQNNLKLNIQNLSLITCASEADILNVALFGLTSKQWQKSNPDLKGNIRDYADVNQLVCLANLESLNAHFIEENISQNIRVEKL